MAPTVFQGGQSMPAMGTAGYAAAQAGTYVAPSSGGGGGSSGGTDRINGISVNPNVPNADGTPYSASRAATVNPSGSNVTAPQPTGLKSLDDILKGLHDYITGSLTDGFTINPALSIQPSTVAKFLTDTASQLNPQLQQQLTNEITGVNASINTLQKSYEATQGQTVQDYQQSLGQLRDQTSMSGGGERALEMGLTNSANRQLSTLDATASQKIGDTLRAGGMDVGQGFAGTTLPSSFGGGSIPGVTGNASSFNIPSIYGRTLSNQGGDSVFAGSANPNSNLDFNYNPSMYVKGALTGQYSTDFFNLLNSTAGNYLQGQAATGNKNILSSYGRNDLIGG